GKPLPQSFNLGSAVISLSFCRGGACVAAGGATAGDPKGPPAALRIWDVETGKEAARLEAHQGGVVVLAAGADGHTFVSASRDGCVVAWDGATFRERYRLQGGRLPGLVSGLA